VKLAVGLLQCQILSLAKHKIETELEKTWQKKHEAKTKYLRSTGTAKQKIWKKAEQQKNLTKEKRCKTCVS
jgi:hypothetical protein